MAFYKEFDYQNEYLKNGSFIGKINKTTVYSKYFLTIC